MMAARGFIDCVGEDIKTRVREKANVLGLYDIHGNVREWTEEMLTKSDTSAPERVLRGGALFDPAFNCSVSSRFRLSPSNRVNDRGFRLAKVP